MNRVVGGGAISLIFLVAVGCRQPSRSQLSLPPPPPQAPGTPLPQGWIWPFAPQEGQRALLAWSVLRPLDVGRIARFQGTGPGTPVQVAPNVWVTALPTRLPQLSSSPSVPPRHRFQESGQGLPEQIDLRGSGHDGPMKNQQMVGVCWAFALSTVMDNALRRAGRQEVMAPLHVLSSKVLEGLWRDGRSSDLVTEPSWPYDPPKACKLNESKSEVWCEEAYHVRRGSWREDPQLVAEVDRARQDGVFRISKTERLQTSPLDTM